MRGIILCVLAAAYLDLARSLQCYFCYEPTEVQNCNEIKTCSVDTPGCKTVTVSPNTGYPFVSGEEMVIRDCAKTCFQTDQDALGQEYEVYCCNGNLCNQLYELAANSSVPNASSDITKSRRYGALVLCIVIVSTVLLI
ncbi:ly6/PLAUR domain-containing protein 2-like [Mixophyes fleayi]|uniref:ly6/PLAUR domain-containing protein 2-like n=1 Tax=Mixophyes fleayi TaxID=3061075 RepID=UPI003F4DB6F7